MIKEIDNSLRIFVKICKDFRKITFKRNKKISHILRIFIDGRTELELKDYICENCGTTLYSKKIILQHGQSYSLYCCEKGSTFNA